MAKMSTGQARQRSYSIVCEEENGKWICLTDSFPMRNIPNIDRNKRMSIDRTASGYLLPPIKEALQSTRRGSNANSLPCPPENLDIKTKIQNPNRSADNEFQSELFEKTMPLSKLKSDNDAYISQERFRLQRRLSEPGSTHWDSFSKSAVCKDRSSSGSSTDMSNTSMKCKQMNKDNTLSNRKLSFKQQNQDVRHDKTVAKDHKTIRTNLETNPQDVYNWTRRGSMPAKLQLENQVVQDLKTGTFLISKFGTEKQISKGSFQNMKFARRVSLPNTSTSEAHLETIKENKTAYLLSKAKSNLMTPNNGLLPQDWISTRGMSLSETTSSNQLNSLENTASESKSKTESNDSLCRLKHNIKHMSNRKLSDPGKTITDLHRDKTEKKAFCTTTPKATIKTNMVSETRRRPRRSRRISDPGGDTCTKMIFGPQIPSVDDPFCPGIDIQKWLETSNPCLDVPLDDNMDPDQIDEPDSESQLLQAGRLSVDGQHRSVSQLLGNSRKAFDNDSEVKSADIRKSSSKYSFSDENEYFDEDFLIRDIIGSVDNTGEDLEQCRNLGAMEQLNQDNKGPNNLSMRRHTIATDDDGYLQAIKYKPKPCYCLRCQIMYAMYFNGDEQLDNWGNYPCFRR